MVYKIHKNIKSSLKETIKGRDPPKALQTPSWKHPPTFSSFLPFLCRILSPPFLWLSVSSQSRLAPDRWFAFSLCAHRGAACFMFFFLLSHRQALFLWRRGEETTSSSLMQGWRCALYGEGKQHAKTEKTSLTPTSMLWLGNYCSELFKCT